MGYTESLLATGERVIRSARQHWFVFVWNARGGVLAIVLAVLFLIVRFVSGGTGLFFDVLGWATLILFLAGLALLGWSFLHYRNEEYLITNRRIIHAEGIINKVATDSSLEKINDAILTESIFGRMFGFGDLEVLTASEAGIERLRMIRDAKDFKKAMLDAKHELEIDLMRPTMPPMRSPEAPEAPEPAPVPAPAPVAPVAAPVHASGEEVASTLARLGELRDKGLITPEEFEAKKTELLGRL
jgi:Bacterial PH domain/Short C-terminal domain